MASKEYYRKHREKLIKKSHDRYWSKREEILKKEREVRKKNPQKYRERDRLRRLRNPEKFKAKGKRAYLKQREKWLSQQHFKYHNNKEYHAIRLSKQKKYREENKELVNKRTRVSAKKTRLNLKIKVFSEYSKKQLGKDIPCCACCEESMLKFLTLDHIEGRKKMGHSKLLGGYKLQLWARENDYPPTLQVLCYNCNLAKGLFGRCPHQK